MATHTPPLSNPDRPNKPFERLKEWLLNKLVAKLSGLLSTPQRPVPPEAIPSLEPLGLARALALAAERRTRLSGRLEEVGREGFLIQEFMEIPPNTEGVEARSLAENTDEALAQMARLRWQLQGDERLLIERLIDAFVIFQRQSSSPQFMLEDPLIRLHRNRDFEAKGLFPWTAVIETENPSLYINLLKPIHGWLGIGVEFTPKTFPRLLAKCRETGGKTGSVGGLLRVAEKTYKMTCDQVVSPSCASVIFRSFPSNNKDVPDVALLQLATDCFKLAEPTDTREVFCASEDIIRECMDARTRVIKLNGFNRGSPGYVYDPAHLLPAQVYGHSVRFPHINIKPDTKTYLFGLVTIPIWNRQFSSEGDSGSWAIESKGGFWLGMIVSGDGYQGSWLVEAGPLLDYLGQKLTGHFTVDGELTPFAFVNGRT